MLAVQGESDVTDLSDMPMTDLSHMPLTKRRLDLWHADGAQHRPTYDNTTGVCALVPSVDAAAGGQTLWEAGPGGAQGLDSTMYTKRTYDEQGGGGGEGGDERRRLDHKNWHFWGSDVDSNGGADVEDSNGGAANGGA